VYGPTAFLDRSARASDYSIWITAPSPLPRRHRLTLTDNSTPSDTSLDTLHWLPQGDLKALASWNSAALCARLTAGLASFSVPYVRLVSSVLLGNCGFSARSIE